MYETYDNVEACTGIEEATPIVTALIAPDRGDCDDEGVGEDEGTGGLNVQDNEKRTVPLEVETETR
jgi:hypothetical protein